MAGLRCLCADTDTVLGTQCGFFYIIISQFFQKEQLAPQYYNFVGLEGPTSNIRPI